MSESPNPSEPASETDTSEEISKPAGKKNKTLMIVAIAVVLILIGSVVAIMALPPKEHTVTPPVLTLTISADPFIVEAGKSTNISCTVKDGTLDISANSGVTYRWTVDKTVGELLLKAKQKVTLDPVLEGSNGTIRVDVTYKNVTEHATAAVRVNAPYLDSIEMSPPTMNVGHFKSKSVSAVAVSSVGTVLPVTNFTWSLKGMNETECDLWGQYDDSVIFNTTDTDRDGVMLNATTTYSTYYGGAKTKTGTTVISVTNIVSPRSVNYRWYDMFNVPFGEWWDHRISGERPFTTTYPYIFIYDMGGGNIWYYANQRLEVTARNITEINTNMMSATVHPFFPHWGTATGGNVVIDWYMQYPTYNEFKAKWPALGGYDGWFVELSGTILLDKQASMAMLGIPSSDFDTSFDTWWATNNASINTRYQSWVQDESGEAHYWIDPAYGTPMMQEDFKVVCSKIGDKIQVKLDSLSWGMETLVTRWLRYTFMPTEWYFEDFSMHMEIGPETSNVDIDTAIVYALYAYETTEVPTGQTHGTPCWVWEALVQDFVGTPSHVYNPDAEHPLNEFQPYVPKTYMNNAPGSLWYGSRMPFDYAPGVFNLSANETLVFEWPANDVTFFVGTGLGTFALIQDKINVTYAEPIDKDMPDFTSGGSIKTDLANRTLTYKGPIDFYAWSKTQTNDTGLKDEWALLGGDLLPYGVPYVEFKANSPPPSVPWSLKVEGMESPIVTGDSSQTVKVTVLDQYGLLYKGYNGTVNFTASGPAVLPANYTFVPATDNGVHNFTGISLTGSGTYWVNVTDVATPSVNGSMEVLIIPEAEHVDHFTITGMPSNINVGDVLGATVTAYDQFGLVYWRYVGTVNITTNATIGTYVIVANYTFTPADRGEHRFSTIVTFNMVGLYDLQVTDTLNASAIGLATALDVKVSPEVTYKMYDLFESPWNEWWWQRDMYEIDLVLSNTPHNYTMLYDRTKTGASGVTYAPYRWNTVAKNMTTLNVNNPEFMPTFGPKNVPGAWANLSMYFNYINDTWYDNYWYPVWSSNPAWKGGSAGYNNSIRTSQHTDGYTLGVTYDIELNREAALTWLNLSLSETNPYSWWNALNSTGSPRWMGISNNWTAWLLNEGNDRLDIYCGYADMLYDMGTMLNITVLPDGNISLKIGHFSWGYEVLATRWTTETNICLHEPYFEDYTLWADYTASKTDVSFDAVAQWSLKAVRANGSAEGSAWAWEPMKIDYVVSLGHDSYYAPYEMLTYTDWNALDPNYGFGLGGVDGWTTYENTPYYFNLTSYQKFTIVLPQGNQVMGYKGLPTWYDYMTGESSILNATQHGNFTDFTSKEVRGEMTLGYYKAGAPNIASMYDPVNKTITMQGPLNFDGYHHWPGGPLYHGAPWIEFNVTPTGTPGPAWTNSVPVTHVTAGASSGAVAMAAVVFGSIVALSALVVFSRRRLDQ